MFLIAEERLNCSTLQPKPKFVCQSGLLHLHKMSDKYRNFSYGSSAHQYS